MPNYTDQKFDFGKGQLGQTSDWGAYPASHLELPLFSPLVTSNDVIN